MARRARFSILGLLLLAALAGGGISLLSRALPSSASTTTGTMSITATGASCAAGKCTAALNANLTVKINAVVPPTEGYVGIQTELDYGTLIYLPTVLATDEIVWPQDGLPLRSPASPTGTEGLVNHASASAAIPPFPTSTFAGTIVQLAFKCTPGNSSNTLVLVPRAVDNTNATGYKSAAAGFPVISAKSTPLTVHCGTAPPTVTNTPSGPTNTPTITRTPTITPTPTPTPLIPDNFMALQLKGPLTSCDDNERPTKCVVLTGETFTLAVDAFNPPPAGYVGMRTRITYGSLTYKPKANFLEEFLWSDVSSELAGRFPASPTGHEGNIGHAATTEGGWPPFAAISHYTGNLIQLTFTCGASPGSHKIALTAMSPADPGGAGSWYRKPDSDFVSAPAQTLTVNCSNPTPTPTNTSTPTPTPTSTNTPTETPTETPTPTDTPTSTLTPTAPAETDTPVPTATAAETPTPPHTVTPTPTHTRTPTPAATATRTPTFTATPLPFAVGDVNKDGHIDALDALWILFYATRLVDQVPSPALADVDLDGDLDPIDAALILQFHAGFINHLPVSGGSGSSAGWQSGFVGGLGAALVEHQAARVR